jgi:hypothetical protein
MSWDAVRVVAAWFAAGFVFGSFVEYWGHRAMHSVRWLGKVHVEHHARGTGQGVALEYLDYLKGTWWMMWPPFLLSLAPGTCRVSIVRAHRMHRQFESVASETRATWDPPLEAATVEPPYLETRTMAALLQ